MSSLDAVELLTRLIAARSYSGAEGPAADVLQAALERAGCRVRRIGHNIISEKGGGAAALVLNSHLDTVPASPGWTRDPWTPAREGDRLYGLGSTDAKSCVAAMAAAFIQARDPGPAGRLIFTATTEEETGGSGGRDGLQTILPELGPIEAGVVGEPTRLNVCHAQRGLVRVLLHAEGRAGHASRPWEGVNAIEIAADDIAAVRAVADEIAKNLSDPLMGRPTLVATVIQGGVAPNVIPDRCVVTLDGRTTRTCDNEAMIQKIRAVVMSRLQIRSQRFQPVATPPDARIVRLALAALPEAELQPFGGVSDMFFLATAPGAPPGGIPSILLGPGDGRDSHQPDESVSVQKVAEAVDAYARICDAYWHCGDTLTGPS